jgi:hypothetical protein
LLLAVLILICIFRVKELFFCLFDCSFSPFFCFLESSCNISLSSVTDIIYTKSNCMWRQGCVTVFRVCSMWQRFTSALLLGMQIMIFTLGHNSSQ